MKVNRNNESTQGVNLTQGIRAGKRPYQTPSRFSLAHFHTRNGNDNELEAGETSGPSGA